MACYCVFVSRVFVRTVCVINMVVWFVCGLSRDVVYVCCLFVVFLKFVCLCVFVYNCVLCVV